MKKIELTELKILAKNEEASTKKFFERLKKKTPKNLDDTFHELHEEVFEQIECLECANCCRSLGPRVTDVDITRLSKHLRIKPSKLIDDYLRLDEDNDYVFKQMPCPFLMTDNYCSVYSERPRACGEYPHTDRKKMFQILNITLQNTYTCPAVFLIVDKLKKMAN